MVEVRGLEIGALECNMDLVLFASSVFSETFPQMSPVSTQITLCHGEALHHVSN